MGRRSSGVAMRGAGEEIVAPLTFSGHIRILGICKRSVGLYKGAPIYLDPT